MKHHKPICNNKAAKQRRNQLASLINIYGFADDPLNQPSNRAMKRHLASLKRRGKPL
ncbi:MAG: hypothetical protein PHY54_11100 [Methylococcales bacterium]|nr:hypothetical protein [Methylococcales bacterium]